jgi:hypothetical protein
MPLDTNGLGTLLRKSKAVGLKPTVHHEAEQFWQVLMRHRPGILKENPVHGRDEANENEEEDQVYQLGDASPVGAVGLDRNWQRIQPIAGKYHSLLNANDLLIFTVVSDYHTCGFLLPHA